MYKVAVFIADHDLRQPILAAFAEAGCTLLVPKHRDDWLEFVCTEQPQFIVCTTAFGDVTLPEIAKTVASHEGLAEIKIFAVISDNEQLQPDWGVSDIIFPPYTSAEIAARLKLAMWRDGHPSGDDILDCGRITINIANYEVTVDRRVIDLTYKEYELLRFLVSHPGRVHTRNSLLNYVWGYDYFGGTRTVDVHIRRLREKLGLEAADHIETVRNVGYRFAQNRNADSE